MRPWLSRTRLNFSKQGPTDNSILMSLLLLVTDTTNPVYEKNGEVTLNCLKKRIMKELLSQYPPKSTYLQNENNLTSALKNPHR